MKQKEHRQFEQAVDAALGWVARLRADTVSREDHQAFALWLGEDASHPVAMDEALDLWDDLGAVRHMPATGDEPAEAANRSRWLPAAIAVAASLVLAVVLWPKVAMDPVSTQLQTAMGERHDFELPDGSRALLNTNSSLNVSYAGDQRHITLTQGEAWFQVKSDATRPFHVDAGDARITALGTAFNVYRDRDSTSVTVTEGVVRVTELGETGARAATVEVLRVNQQLTASDDGWKVSVPDMEQQLAWRQGQLVAREMPLAELIAQLQRYYETDILLTDPDIAARTVSGVFDLDQPEATLGALALSLDLKTEPLDTGTVQLLKSGQ